MNAQEFLNAFVAAPAATRVQMVQTILRNTNDTRIHNLFASLNYNDVSKRNAGSCDNIHYVTAMLRSFIGLRLTWK
jgi:hypothetical protein